VVERAVDRVLIEGLEIARFDACIYGIGHERIPCRGSHPQSDRTTGASRDANDLAW